MRKERNSFLVHSEFPRQSPDGIWGPNPQKLTTFSQNNTWTTSSTETLDNICSRKSTLQHFQGGGR